jgi:serine O-acetyltransferase
MFMLSVPQAPARRVREELFLSLQHALLPPDWVPRPDLPTREQIAELVDIFRAVVFPAYFATRTANPNAFAKKFRYDLLSLHATLVDIIDAVQKFELGNDRNVFDDAPEQLADLVISRLPELQRTLEHDAETAWERDPAAASTDEVILAYPGFLAVLIYRVAHLLTQYDIPLLPRLLSEYGHSVTGADIHPEAEIGDRFFIDHATGVVIGQTTIIGDDVTLYQGVTLGAKSVRRSEAIGPSERRHPHIGDNVVIYANATILGGDTVIGDDAVIGGSVWITQSIEPGTKVQIGRPDFLCQQTHPCDESFNEDWSL